MFIERGEERSFHYLLKKTSETLDCGYTFFTYIINKYIFETDHAAKTHFVGRPKKMNEFDDDINIREQVFHNAIREYVVSCFNFLYLIQFK